jgi:aminotransferase
MSNLSTDYDAVDLAMGAPDLPIPPEIRDAAIRALREGHNQYTSSRGLPALRRAIAAKTLRHMGVAVDPETEVSVTCGTTEGMLNVMMSITEPGDEVILFEPFLPNYIPAIRANGAIVRFVLLRRPDWSFDPEALAAAFNARTKAIVINTPGNPCGKVFTDDELRFIADLCERWNVLCVTDEIYEHIVFDGRRHRSMLQIESMRERTIVLNGLSKTYYLTGWRIGHTIAPPALTELLNTSHRYTTYCAPSPLQVASVAAYEMPDSYYDAFTLDMEARRAFLMAALDDAGFPYYKPAGGFFILADISSFGLGDAAEFAQHLIRTVGVSSVPGSTFFSDPDNGRDLVRFCFGKSDATLAAAAERLNRLR